jgi:hypothetical protein
VVQQCGAWSKFHIPQKSFFCFFMFFVLISWQFSCESLVMKLDFVS